MATIKSPVEGYKGTIVGVEFEDGSGSTDDERAIAYFVEAGFEVSGADGFEVIVIEEKPLPVLGQPIGLDVEIPPLADAADPRNDLVPVGGVKSDGTIVAPAKDGNGEDVAPKPEPAAPVQETGNPDEQSAVPASPNPGEAVSTPDGDAQPTTDEPTGAPASSGDAPSGEASQDASGGIISSDPAPADEPAGKHAADQPADDDTTPADAGSSKKGS